MLGEDVGARGDWRGRGGWRRGRARGRGKDRCPGEGAGGGQMKTMEQGED